MSPEPRIAIVGAGPTGLGAAWRLQERGHAQWSLYEAADGPGGLASSVVEPDGFTWDLGGHVLHSHYPYFDAVMTRALGDAWVDRARDAWVWRRGRWIPYPLQNNLWRLPKPELEACIRGVEAVRDTPGPPPVNFRDWLLASFGRGICDSFLLPYNAKVWAYDPSMLDIGWMGERVAGVDLERIRQNADDQRDDVSWGPNATFRYPLRGGTGAIWKAVTRLLPSRQLRFGARVVSVDVHNRRLLLDDGTRPEYDALISTMPLDVLVRSLDGAPELAGVASQCVYSSSHVVGIGMQGSPPAALATKCWIYFPEPDVPFYRATVFSNYSPNNAPPGHWSLIGEVSESPVKPVNADTVVNDVIAGFRSCGLIDPATIVCAWHRRLQHGYPTPWLGRDRVLDTIEPALRALGIFSRGRFGAWKYEVSNQDHSFMQGVEAVEQILSGVPERTFHGDMTSDLTPPQA